MPASENQFYEGPYRRGRRWRRAWRDLAIAAAISILVFIIWYAASQQYNVGFGVLPQVVLGMFLAPIRALPDGWYITLVCVASAAAIAWLMTRRMQFYFRIPLFVVLIMIWAVASIIAR